MLEEFIIEPAFDGTWLGYCVEYVYAEKPRGFKGLWHSVPR